MVDPARDQRAAPASPWFSPARIIGDLIEVRPVVPREDDHKVAAGAGHWVACRVSVAPARPIG